MYEIIIPSCLPIQELCLSLYAEDRWYDDNQLVRYNFEMQIYIIYVPDIENILPNSVDFEMDMIQKTISTTLSDFTIFCIAQHLLFLRRHSNDRCPFRWQE